MPSTTSGGLPIPVDGDALSNGALAIRNLAEALDREYSKVFCSAATTINSTAVTALPGMTVTKTPPAASTRFRITTAIDVRCVTALSNAVVTNLYVDGTIYNTGTEPILFLAAAGHRLVLERTWEVSGLSLAAHTFTMRSTLAVAGGSGTIDTNSTMRVEMIG